MTVDGGLRTLAAALAAVLLLDLGAAAQEARVPSSRAEVDLSFAPLVNKAAPAVVNIYTRRVQRARPISPLFNDPFFRRFFGDAFGFDRPRERVQNALGSGVIVRPEGMIVTNHHLIEGAEGITVVLADRREFDATIVGTDERTDLAVLTIEPEGEAMPYLELRDSDELQVGDLVLAIGNPFGVGQTVTSGIVSALARTQVGISDLNFFIQTDAAINPGNSGGALVTMDGKLAGINSAIFSKSGGSHGIGFAIPANMVRSVIAGLTSPGGRLVRPWFGATGQGVTAEIASSLGMARPTGVLINDVYGVGPPTVPACGSATWCSPLTAARLRMRTRSSSAWRPLPLGRPPGFPFGDAGASGPWPSSFARPRDSTPRDHGDRWVQPVRRRHRCQHVAGPRRGARPDLLQAGGRGPRIAPWRHRGPPRVPPRRHGGVRQRP